MKRTFIFLSILGVLAAQTQVSRPAFEAASIKVSSPDAQGSSSHGSRGQVIMINQTMRRLIERAYNVKPGQVVGPAWLDDVHFDVSAKYPEETKLDDRPIMLRTLLEERFKLTAHRETREISGYAILVAKSGFKLKPVPPGDSHSSSNGGDHVVLEAQNSSMQDLANNLSRHMGEIVVDKTGLDGVYDYKLQWNVDSASVTGKEDRANALLVALQDAVSPLGLRLQAQKVPVEVIVVDHVEHAPTEN